VLVVVTLSGRLGLAVLIGDVRALGQGAGAVSAGAQGHEHLVFALWLGAQSIGGCDVLCSGRTGRLLGGATNRVGWRRQAARLRQADAGASAWASCSCGA